jgi:hypothetical protein
MSSTRSKYDGALRRRVLAVSLALVATLATSIQQAWATDWRLSADLPATMAMGLDDGIGDTYTKSGSSVSGYVVALSSPWWLGLDYESYGANFPLNAVIGSFSYDVTMMDVFLDFTLPYARLAIGAGQGTGKLSNVRGASFQDANLTQAFVSAGWEVFGHIDIHAAYHGFSGKNKANTAGFNNLKVSGDMWSIGAGVQF